MPTDTDTITRLLRPCSVAVIGASADPRRIGGRPVDYLRRAGYAGAVYPVNPGHAQVQGLAAYPAIGRVPAKVDLAVIALPAQAAVAEAAACARAGVGAALIFSADFAETGPEGVARQTALTRIARESGMRILGPNCLGVFNAHTGLYCTFTSTIEGAFPRAGRTAIVSQSGGYGSHLFMVARNRGIDVGYWITTGNECDLELGECLLWAARQDDVDVILAYAEGVRDGAVLREAFATAKAAGKAVLFLKAGRSAAGSAAVATHTAALTGADAVYDAMFRQHGVARVGTTEEMVDAAVMCCRGVPPPNERIALVTISGAMGVQMADAAESAGLDVAPLPEEAQARLKALTPFASPRNPVDITAQAFNDLGLVERNLGEILDTGLYGSLVAFFTTTVSAPAMADKLRALLAPLPARYSNVLLVLGALAPSEIVAQYEAAGWVAFEEPVRAIRAIAAAIAARAPVQAAPVAPSGVARSRVDAAMLQAAARHEVGAKALLASLGIGVPPGELVAGAGAAVEAAARLGPPVAAKVVSTQLTHKTEAGAVALDLRDGAAVRDACARMLASVQAHAPGALIDGLLVERMAERGIEVIVGIQRDPALGPVVMFGLGGVRTELYRDVSLRVAPIDEAEALRMVRDVKAWPLLDGFRGAPKADVGALARIVAAVSRFAAAHADDVESLDINPLIVHEAGAGATAVDAVLVLRPRQD